MTTSLRRPLLRWHGGKWRLAPWIIAHLPPHRIYVEPFGGAASVLLRKRRAYAEIYNDLDGEVVNLFRVLRSPDAEALIRALELTPFARGEFDLSYEPTDDAVEAARRLIIRSHMGFGSNAHATAKTGRLQTGFRANSNRSGTIPAHDWRDYPAALASLIERLRGVIIEHRDAQAVMTAHDHCDTLHYVDPPYLHSLRNPGNHHDGKHLYRHELSDDDHIALLGFLRDLDGMVVLSGYPSPLYDDALPGWRQVTCKTMADGARDRTEALWLSPQAVAQLHGELPLEAA